MNNIEALRSLLKGELLEDEANEFLDALKEEFEEKEDKIEELEKEIGELEESIEDKDDELDGYEEHVIAGLDTIYIKLDQGNMEIQSRVDTFIERLKKHYNASQA